MEVEQPPAHGFEVRDPFPVGDPPPNPKVGHTIGTERGGWIFQPLRKAAYRSAPPPGMVERVEGLFSNLNDDEPTPPTAAPTFANAAPPPVDDERLPVLISAVSAAGRRPPSPRAGCPRPAP